jgi:hypothetical protein
MFLTLLLTLVVGGGSVLVNVRLDIYGIFRDPRGRELPIYASEGRAKYFLNLRYVPRNFDAVLIGSSVSDNWPVQDIRSFKVYNESTDGGNITVQKLLVERALREPGLRAVLCVVHPYITHKAGIERSDMSEDEYWGALGSLSLLQAYQRKAKVALGRGKPVWDQFGSEEVPAPPELNPELRAIMLPDGEVHVDETAFAEYRDLVAELRAKGIALAAVVPPTTEPLFEQRRAEMGRYVARMRALFAPSDVFLDLSTPEHADLQRDPTNFKDGVHLTASGARKIVALLDQALAAHGSATR